MDHRIPVVITERRESGIPSDSSVADNAVPCAVCLNILRQYFTALLAIGNVKCQQAPCAASGEDSIQRFLCSLHIAMIVYADHKTVRGQLSGDGATDTFAGTRN